MILDCHMHTWRYPEDFRREAMLANEPPRRRGWSEPQFQAMFNLPLDQYLDEMRQSRVERALLLGLKAGNSLGIEVDNEHLAAVARAHPETHAWACCVTPTDAGAAAEVERCVKTLGAVGIGELGPAYGGYRLDDPACFAVWELCRDLDVPVVVHAGPAQARRARNKFADLSAVDEVAIQFPELRIVICHLGYPRYEEASFLIAKHENVFADISWLPQLAGFDRRILSRYLPPVEYGYFHLAYPLLYAFNQTFGMTDKLIWGSDFPAGSPVQSVSAVEGVNRWLAEHQLPQIPDDAIQRILHENWRKVFTRLSAMAG